MLFASGFFLQCFVVSRAIRIYLLKPPLEVAKFVKRKRGEPAESSSASFCKLSKPQYTDAEGNLYTHEEVELAKTEGDEEESDEDDVLPPQQAEPCADVPPEQPEPGVDVDGVMAPDLLTALTAHWNFAWIGLGRSMNSWWGRHGLMSASVGRAAGFSNSWKIT